MSMPDPYKVERRAGGYWGITGCAEVAVNRATATRWAQAANNEARAHAARRAAQLAEATAYQNRPCAAHGLVSYRFKMAHGVVMIGARDDADAMREARRSTSAAGTLERWNGETYSAEGVQQ